METNISILSASGAPFIPLSAAYKWDDNITLNPKYFQYPEGYSFFKHPIFEKSKDALFQNESFLSISPTESLSSFFDGHYTLDPTEFVLFTALQNISGFYIKNVDDTLYAKSSIIDQSCLFRFRFDRDNGTWNICQNGLYATVEITPRRTFIIRLKEKLEPDTHKTQQFIIQTHPGYNKVTIRSLLKMSEWGIAGWSDDVTRFWSYSEYGGNDVVPSDDFVVKTMGMVIDDDYLNDNNYVWTLGLGDSDLLTIGYNGIVYWVKYYNDIYNKVFNKTTDIKEAYKSMGNLLIDWAYTPDTIVATYDCQTKTGTMEVNLAQLKNVHTPNYDYTTPLLSETRTPPNNSGVVPETTYTLTVLANPSIGGVVFPINQTYIKNTNVNIWANPATGYKFDGWSGDLSTQSDSSFITEIMNKNRTITGNFSLIPTG